jgi:phosphatidylserine decarboxylase
VSEFLAILLQYLLPKKMLTRLAGRLAVRRGGAFSATMIAVFARRYRVDMTEAAEPDMRAYASFNDFFTRALRDGARPLAAGGLVCPVDGAISECGDIDGSQIFQAKGHCYSTLALLGGDAGLAARFESGSFATLYLSPRDYHRIHMPCAGRLLRMIHVPGRLFSVNPAMTRGIPELFARNERVVCVFDSETGPFALVLVGAAIVGSVATTWHGVVMPPHGGQARIWHYEDGGIMLARGAEMGRFLLGSTVVALFAHPGVRFAPGWATGKPVRMGEAMGRAGVA